MNEYTVLRLDGALPDISNREFDPDAEMKGAAYAPIALYPWDNTGYTPEARGYLFYNDEGLHVLLCAKEETIAAVETRFCGNVCHDSCLEFFVTPRPDVSTDYINMESNILTTMYIAMGPDRHTRRRPDGVPQGVCPAASKHNGGWWAVSFHVPMHLLQEEYGIDQLTPGQVMRGNFYHCDETIHPNFGMWNMIPTAAPDFHQPAHFGTLRFGSETVAFS